MPVSLEFNEKSITVKLYQNNLLYFEMFVNFWKVFAQQTVLVIDW